MSQCWSWGEITAAGIYFLARLVVAALCAGGVRDVISEAICHSSSPPTNLPNRTISSSLYLRVCVYVTHDTQWWCARTRWQCCYLDVSCRHPQRRCLQHKDVLLDASARKLVFLLLLFDLEEELLAGGWLPPLWGSTQIKSKWRDWKKCFFKGSKYENKHFIKCCRRRCRYSGCRYKTVPPLLTQLMIQTECWAALGDIYDYIRTLLFYLSNV